MATLYAFFGELEYNRLMETVQPMPLRSRPIGMVEQIPCPNCKMLRWDDGKPCSACGEYARAWIKPEERQHCVSCGHKAYKFVFGLPVCGTDSCTETAWVMAGKVREA